MVNSTQLHNNDNAWTLPPCRSSQFVKTLCGYASKSEHISCSAEACADCTRALAALSRSGLSIWCNRAYHFPVPRHQPHLIVWLLQCNQSPSNHKVNTEAAQLESASHLLLTLNSAPVIPRTIGSERLVDGRWDDRTVASIPSNAYAVAVACLLISHNPERMYHPSARERIGIPAA